MTNKLKPLTPEEIAWVNQQPVVGESSPTRLRAALEAAGWRPVELALHPDGENVEFRLERGPVVRQLDREQTLRRLITVFRSCGFEVGFTEMALAEFDDDSIHGITLVGRLELVCEHGPLLVGP